MLDFLKKSKLFCCQAVVLLVDSRVNFLDVESLLLDDGNWYHSSIYFIFLYS